MDIKEYKKFLGNPDEIFRKYFFGQKFCMSYSPHLCDELIVNAHTISKKYLRSMSSNGKVYYPSLFNNYYKFSPLGLRKCSTFLGFCQHHDKKLFRSFEDMEYIGEYQQIFDYSYRIVCREFFQKKNLLKFLNKLLRVEIPELNNFVREDAYSKKIFLARSVREHRILYNNMQSCRHQGLKYIQIKLSRIPIATTGVYFPPANCKGELLQHAEQSQQRSLIYFILPVQGFSYICIAYPSSKNSDLEYNYTSSVLDSLKDMDFIIDYLLTIFFDNNDVIALQPQWFESLNATFQREIHTLINRRRGKYFETNYKKVDFLDFSKNLEFKLQAVRKNL